MKLGKILVTSAWPYVNVIPHLGNLVGSILSADVFARYCRLKGEDVVMVSGSDEHGTPTEVEAVRLGIAPKELADRNHAKIVELFRNWGISFDNYTRTENPVHKNFVQAFLKRVYENGYISTRETEMLFCEKCNRFLPDRYVVGKCPYCGHERARGDQCEECGRLLETTLLVDPHCSICGDVPVVKATKHWHFDLPKLSRQIANYISSNEQLSSRTKNFSLNFVKEGLKSRAVTRDVSWGIQAPFPGAEDKTIYVWVEAVLGYVSATIEHFEKSGDLEKWKEYWFNKQAKTLYFIGKDNITFHTIILPALLLASGEEYNLPWKISATEFLQFRGEKASKSQRIGIWIDEALELFPADYWRYFLMSTRPETKDTNFSWKLFIDKVNADLNDALGNFVHRTLTFIDAHFEGTVPTPKTLDAHARHVLLSLDEKVNEIAEMVEDCMLQSAANNLMNISRIGNQYLTDEEPWKSVKDDRNKAASIIHAAAQIVKALAIVSAPFIPYSAEMIWKTLKLPGSVHEQRWSDALKPFPVNHRIGKAEPLFRKIDVDAQELQNRLEKIRQESVESV